MNEMSLRKSKTAKRHRGRLKEQKKISEGRMNDYWREKIENSESPLTEKRRNGNIK